MDRITISLKKPKIERLAKSIGPLEILHPLKDKVRCIEEQINELENRLKLIEKSGDGVTNLVAINTPPGGGPAGVVTLRITTDEANEVLTALSVGYYTNAHLRNVTSQLRLLLKEYD